MALSRTRTVAAITLSIALALILGSSAAVVPADALASGTTITAVEGAVVISHRGEDLSAAHEGDVLAAGDTIRTSARATAEITYFDGSSLVLEPESELVIQRLVSEPASSPIKTIERTWHVMTKLVSGGSRYEVRTPSFTASVRG